MYLSKQIGKITYHNRNRWGYMLENKKPKQKPGPPKGTTNNPHGRPAGTPNKATNEARQAIASFVDGNAHRLTEWLDQVAVGIPEQDIKPNPAKAFELFQSVVEYHIPKLARTELTGADGGALVVEIVRFGKDTAP
jgi:hypothetical protein